MFPKKKCSRLYFPKMATVINHMEKKNKPKPKNFSSSKDTAEKMKRQVTKWEKILANNMRDEG